VLEEEKNFKLKWCEVGLVRDGDGGGVRKELGNTQLLRGNIGIIGTLGY
jgi:hypothetical protein